LNWSVYIVVCNDGTYYTGATNNVDKRIHIHNSGKGAKYTRSRLPVHLVAKRDGMTKSDALSLEYKVKKKNKKHKVNFLKGIKSEDYS
jgi:putative endonuclease